MVRYTEYHAGVPVLKDKTKMKEAMSRFAELEERDTEKKPYYEGDGYDGDGKIIYDIWKCPNCDARYEVDYDVYDFCPRCGQRLMRGIR